jgi:hypothetical protein
MMKAGVSMFFDGSGVVRQQQTGREFAAAQSDHDPRIMARVLARRVAMRSIRAFSQRSVLRQPNSR